MIGARHERPIGYSADSEEIFAIVTQPPRPNGVGVVLLSGGDFIPSTNRNRLYVRLARRLAEEGYYVVRVDYHGVGESSGEIRGYASHRPFVHDVDGAVAWLAGAGIADIVLVGNCFGSRTALAAAGRTSGLRAIALISSPVRDFGSGERLPTRLARDGGMGAYLLRGLRIDVLRRSLLGRYRRRYASIIRAWAREKVRRTLGGEAPDLPGTADGWVSERFIRQLAEVVRRRIPVLLIYGQEEDLFNEFTRARAGALGAVLDKGQARVEIRPLAGTVHGFPTVAVQDAVRAQVEEWIRRVAPGREAPPRPVVGRVGDEAR